MRKDWSGLWPRWNPNRFQVSVFAHWANSNLEICNMKRLHYDSIKPYKGNSPTPEHWTLISYKFQTLLWN
jgi:hypothetical protein